MLTFLKQLFVWWNQQTFGTRIQTFFSGKLIGVDSFGNKYYENKLGKRLIINPKIIPKKAAIKIDLFIFIIIQIFLK